MRDETILSGLAMASQAIRQSEGVAQHHSTEEHQAVRLALIAADAAAETVATRHQADPSAMTMARRQAALNRPHYEAELEQDWRDLTNGTAQCSVPCRLVVEGHTMSQWYECTRDERDERTTPCLSCFFVEHHVGDVMRVAEPDGGPIPDEPDDRDPFDQAMQAIGHLHAAAAATNDTTYERVLLAIDECADFAIRAAERSMSRQPPLK